MFNLTIGNHTETMGLLEWSTKIVGSLAWPVAAIIIAAMFRSQIRTLLAKLRKLTWGDRSVHFAEQLDQIEDVARVEGDGIGSVEIAATSIDAKFEKLLAISPSAAILDAWAPIETKLILLATPPIRKPALGTRPIVTPLRAIDALSEEGTLPDGARAALLDMRRLRNAAAHQDVSATDALRFRGLALKIGYLLDQL